MQQIRQSLLLSVLMVGLVIVGYAVTLPADQRSRATQERGIDTQLPYPHITTTPPYLRLFVPLQTYSTGDTIDVSVLLNTQNRVVSEADIGIMYDPTVLAYIPSSLQKTTVFTTLQRDEMTKGTVSFVLFSPFDEKIPSIVTASDTRIASVSFTILSNHVKSTSLRLTTGTEQGTPSFLYGVRANDGAVYNILNTVVSTDVLIH